jgi:two-component system LytT family response regulator
MKKLTAVIIDDEKMARTLLQGMLRDISVEVEVLALCGDLPEGIKAIRKFKPDIVFLDIEMPGHSGLEILDFFDENEVHFFIIFTTAYNEYAIKAFKLSAIDYLLKPIQLDELQTAVQKCNKTKLNTSDLSLLKLNMSETKNKKIAIPQAGSIRFVNLFDIIYLKADGSYTNIFIKSEPAILSSKSLKYFEEIINQNPNFFRCQKSYIINITYVTGYTKNDSTVHLCNLYNIPVSIEKTSELLNRIES